MIVRIDKAFEKDTDKIRDIKILNLIADCIENIQKATKIDEINHLKKLQGYNSHYRIKIKDYRIGLIIEIYLSALGFFLVQKFNCIFLIKF